MAMYSPFDKPLGLLEASDFGVLREVEEGFFIEYKGQLVEGKRIAKSLASFANQRGGWLFLGIAESRDHTHTAAAFPGLPLSELDLAKKRIQAAASQLQPAVDYDVRVPMGPCESLGLAADRGIVVVRVPEGLDPPYLHGDGRVYVRQGDASDPIPESNRFALEQLWSKRNERLAKLREYVTDESFLEDHENDTAYLRLCLFGEHGFHGAGAPLEFSQFQEIMRNRQGDGYTTLFDNTFTCAEGFVARQTQSNDPWLLAPMWESDVNATSRITIPLRIATGPPGKRTRFSQLEGYDRSAEFLQLLHERGHTRARIADLNLLVAIVIGTLQTQHALMLAANSGGQLRIAFQLGGIRRVTPFVDSARLLSFLREHGVPVVQTERALVPQPLSRDRLIPLRSSPKDNFDEFIGGAYTVIGFILEALGIPFSLLEELLPDLHACVIRAIEVQKGHLRSPPSPTN